VHLDLWGLSLVDTDPGPLRAFMWIVDHLFNLRGVTADTPVVVYDEQSGMRSARAFWFLEYFGHRQVQMLDGGFGAWIHAQLPVTRDAAAPPKSTWTGTPQPDTIATWRDVRERLGRPGTVIVDTRSDGEYQGTTVRAKRGGAIPGAVHVEWSRNLTLDGLRIVVDCANGRVRRRDARQGGRHLLSGRLPRRAWLCGVAFAGLSARPELHRVVEGMGRPY
jgi:thiosulfate/3-mercaptopyruvate sulfurtransferase